MRDGAISRRDEVRKMTNALAAALVVYGTYTEFDGEVVEETVSSVKQPLFVNETPLTEGVSIVRAQVNDR
jgi:hypothetical protein